MISIIRLSMDYIFIINLFRDTNVDSIFYIFIVKLIKKSLTHQKACVYFGMEGVGI
jgi:hypothetical protein